MIGFPLIPRDVLRDARCQHCLKAARCYTFVVFPITKTFAAALSCGAAACNLVALARVTPRPALKVVR